MAAQCGLRESQAAACRGRVANRMRSCPRTGINLTNQFLIAMPGMADDSLCRRGGLPVRAQRQGRAGPGDQQADRHQAGQPVREGRAEPGHRPRSHAGRARRSTSAARSRPSAASCCTSRCRRRPSAYNSTLTVPGGLEMTTSKDVLEAMSNGAGPRRVLVTLGYSGWAGRPARGRDRPQRLAHRRRRPEVIFDTPVEKRYERALGLLGIDPRMLSTGGGACMTGRATVAAHGPRL